MGHTAVCGYNAADFTANLDDGLIKRAETYTLVHSAFENMDWHMAALIRHSLKNKRKREI